MPRKKRKERFSLTKWIKQMAWASLIFFLALILAQLAGSLPPQQPVKLPGSESTVELYSNQTEDDLTQIYLQAIGSAQQSVVLAIYGLVDDTIIEALRKKSEAGIPVHIVCDAEGSKGISKRLHGPEIVKRLGNGLMHQKILIIDRRFILLGSANLTHGSLNTHGNLVIGMNHPQLAEVLTQRTKSMDDDGAFAPLLHQETTAGAQKIELWVLPDDAAAVDRMKALFRSAKKSIKVAMYTWTRTDFTQELLAAAHRGVEVEAVIDRRCGNGSSAKIVQMLEKGGIPITLSTGQGLLHHKFAYIDETILVNGSANWTQDAFRKNDDYFLILHDLTPEQRKKMSQLCQIIKKQSEKPGKLRKRKGAGPGKGAGPA